ncbi:hypothetical protein Tco_0984068, partial [Tanacetum coccineum]
PVDVNPTKKMDVNLTKKKNKKLNVLFNLQIIHALIIIHVVGCLGITVMSNEFNMYYWLARYEKWQT